MPTYYLQPPANYNFRHSHSSSRDRPAVYYLDPHTSEPLTYSGTRYNLSRYPSIPGGYNGGYYDESSHRRHHSISHRGEYHASPSHSHRRSTRSHSRSRHTPSSHRYTETRETGRSSTLTVPSHHVIHTVSFSLTSSSSD